MGCLSENAVLEFLQGGLSAEAALAVEDHVDGCDDCRRLLAETARSLGAPEGLDRGAAIGRYMVLAPVGAGGMGVVYAAYDPELDRKVAIKLLRPDVQGASGQQLLREAQAMARLSHPNVVAVHDAGTYEGRVFVAMEYVEGETLSTWRKRQPRTWREVLAVYVAAGRGLAAAHAAGLVHRDFKPDNVIIDKERVRVTDFGLARPVGATAPPAANEASSDRTTAIAGTPAYMAPEQRVGEPVDARSDQYSFCVSLYEALHGVRPNEPDEGATRASIPHWIRRALARGLAEDPAARFPSMDALVAELSRDPRAVLRRRISIAAAVALVVAGFVGWRSQRAAPCRGASLASVWNDARKQSVRDAFARTGAPYANDAYAGVARALDDYARDWALQRTDACEATRVRGEQSDELLDLRMQCLDARREELSALAELYSHADDELVRRAVQAAHALTPLSDCADRAALTHRTKPPADPAARAKITSLRAELARVKAQENAGRYRDAADAVQPLADAARKLAWRPLEAEVLYQQARIVDRTGDARAAEQLFHASLRAAEAGRADTTSVAALLDLVYVVGYEQGRHADGDVLALDARAALERIGNPELQTASFEAQLGTLTGEEWKIDESLAHYQRALALREKLAGPDSLEVGMVLTNLGITYYQRGEYEKALATHQRAIAIRERLLGRSHPEVAMALTDYGNACAALDRLDDALAAQQRAVAIWNAALGEDHPNVATGLLNRGAVYAMKGRDDDALADFRRALTIRLHTLGESHLETATALNDIGELLVTMKQYGEAEKHFRRALTIIETVGGAEHPDYADTLANLGMAEYGDSRNPKALHELERAVEIAEKALGPTHPNLAPLLTNLGRVRLGTGRGDARAPLERALAIREASHAPELDLAETRFWLAKAADKADLVEQARTTLLRYGERGKRVLSQR
jgi:tetratricopeptide (TPR) repeat protein